MRICKNRITDHLIEFFDANILHVPNARYKPLYVVELRDKKTTPLGKFQDLIIGEINNTLPLYNDPMPDVSGIWTKKASIGNSIKVLSGIFKAFGLDLLNVKGAFNRVKKMSFSFDNVQRNYIEVLALGKILSEQKIKGDTDNIFIDRIMNSNKYRLVLITDSIESNNFSISTYAGSDSALAIDMPIIENYISELNLNVTIDKKAENELKFSRPDPIPFGFSCIEIQLDEQGNLTAGEWLEGIRALNPELGNDATSDLIPKFLIDHDLNQPLLIE